MSAAVVRPIDLDTITLERGSHEPDGRYCAMELAAYMAGEPWSDHPACVSPTIAVFCRAWNDQLNDQDRQMLKPLVPRLIGSAGTPEQELERSRMALLWLVTEHAPAWLDLAGLPEHATALRSLAPSAVSDGSARPALIAAGDAARAAARAAAWDAARDAAGVAARDAARDAAWAAARAAAGVAARDAARDAAWAAARAAAWDAARDAAWDAAWDAARDAARAAAGATAGDALRPTVEQVQQSALALLGRMIDVQAGPA